MAKQLILAVAGSGKTSKILDSIDLQSRSLIVTYTHENHRSLEAGIIKKFGKSPANIVVLTYFSFLYRYCIQPFFSYQLRDRSFTWKPPPRRPFRAKDDVRHYLTPTHYLYANRAAKLPLEFGAVDGIKARLERHFDKFFVDEVQDFAANDFNLLLELTKANIEFMLVGDFFQHTFDTSRDGTTRMNLHKKGVESYLEEFKSVGIDVDTTSLDKTHRCSQSVCDFITEIIGVPIASHRTDKSDVKLIENEDEALALARDPEKVTLFLKEHDRYECHTNNWGRCKGLNSYVDVCVALNSRTFTHFKAGTIPKLSDQTKNKLYVACSRARGDLFLMEERLLKRLKRL